MICLRKLTTRKSEMIGLKRTPESQHAIFVKSVNDSSHVSRDKGCTEETACLALLLVTSVGRIRAVIPAYRFQYTYKVFLYYLISRSQICFCWCFGPIDSTFERNSSTGTAIPVSVR